MRSGYKITYTQKTPNHLSKLYLCICSCVLVYQNNQWKRGHQFKRKSVMGTFSGSEGEDIGGVAGRGRKESMMYSCLNKISKYS